MKLITYLLLINLLTLIAYWLDKRAARAGGWRWPEASLLLLGFLGGWPAGLFAQQKLRHKNRKRSFQFKFWALVAAEIALLLWQPAMLQPIIARLGG